jgi:predicted dehydrogenase
MSRLNRRSFLQGSLAIAGGAFAGGAFAKANLVAPNDKVRVAVAGLNGRGGSHVGEYVQMADVDIVCLIDPDKRTWGKRIQQIEKAGRPAPKCVQDVREALDDPNIDAISIATPNHWHALMTIWACEAGKDVYVEKPCSHNVHEGRIALEMARKHQRIVQHGTQSRSSKGWAEVMEVVKSGQLGKLLVSRGLCYKSRKSIGMKPVATPPEELDFNLWLGPAKDQPYHENLVHYNWHWFWETGNGDIGNQGVHQMDIARWAIPGATLPKSVISLGGRFGYEDQGETANTQISIMDYGDTQLIFEVRGLPTEKYHGEMVGNILHLEEGIIAGQKFYPRGSKEPAPLPKVEAKRGPGSGNFGNFIAAVKSRKTQDLNADILEGHYSSALCHLANISYRLGESVPFEPKRKAFGDNREAYESLARMEEHLARDNGLNLDGLKYRLGRKLTVDAAAETFVGDAEANQLLTRNYRAPFTVPAKIA